VSTASTKRNPWGLSLRARVIIALVSAMIIGAKFYLRFPLHIPGHSGLFWMALIVVGVGLVRRPGAGMLIGLLTAVMATVLLPGRQGILVGAKYFIPGLLFDLLTPLLGGRLDRVLVAMVVASAANVAKLATAYVLGLVAGVPGGFLALGIGFAATTHLTFGALGGLVGALVLKRLVRAGMTLEPLPVTVMAMEADDR
jgi:hypothetical protein